MRIYFRISASIHPTENEPPKVSMKWGIDTPPHPPPPFDLPKKYGSGWMRLGYIPPSGSHHLGKSAAWCSRVKFGSQEDFSAGMSRPRKIYNYFGLQPWPYRVGLSFSPCCPEFDIVWKRSVETTDAAPSQGRWLDRN